MKTQLVSRSSYIVAAVSLIISFVIFFNTTSEFLGSLTAAIITAALVWISYVLVRWVVLSLTQ